SHPTSSCFLFSCSAPPRAVHSFPTRRSSDLLRYESRLHDGFRAAQIAKMGPEGKAVLPAMDDATHVVLDHDKRLERDAPIELPRVHAHSRILRYGASSASTANGKAVPVPVTCRCSYHWVTSNSMACRMAAGTSAGAP